jgi:hypothetical protein
MAKLTRKQRPIGARRLAKLIYLRFHPTPGCGYIVETSGYDGNLPIEVATAAVGHAIVRALREVAAPRPDAFPPSKLNGAQ